MNYDGSPYRAVAAQHLNGGSNLRPTGPGADGGVVMSAVPITPPANYSPRQPPPFDSLSMNRGSGDSASAAASSSVAAAAAVAIHNDEGASDTTATAASLLSLRYSPSIESAHLSPSARQKPFLASPSTLSSMMPTPTHQSKPYDLRRLSISSRTSASGHIDTSAMLSPCSLPDQYLSAESAILSTDDQRYFDDFLMQMDEETQAIMPEQPALDEQPQCLPSEELQPLPQQQHHQPPLLQSSLVATSTRKRKLHDEQPLIKTEPAPTPTAKRRSPRQSATPLVSSTPSMSATVPATPASVDSSASKPSQMSEEEKRLNHIQAEQRRRNVIRNGFNELVLLVPSLRKITKYPIEDLSSAINLPPNSSLVPSKSTVLTHTADFIADMTEANNQLREKLVKLRAQAFDQRIDQNNHRRMSSISTSAQQQQQQQHQQHQQQQQQQQQAHTQQRQYQPPHPAAAPVPPPQQQQQLQQQQQQQQAQTQPPHHKPRVPQLPPPHPTQPEARRAYSNTAERTQEFLALFTAPLKTKR